MNQQLNETFNQAVMWICLSCIHAFWLFQQHRSTNPAPQTEEEAHLYFEVVMVVWRYCVEQVGSHVNKLPVNNNEQLVIPVSDLSFQSHLLAHADE